MATSSPIDKEQPKHKVNPKKDNLRVLVINFQGLRSKEEAFAACLENHNPDLVIGTESWLDNTVLDSEVFPPNYSMSRRDRNSNTGGGGVFVVVRGDIIATHATELDSENCELLWVRIQIAGSKTILFGTFYRTPNQSGEYYMNLLRQSLEKIKPDRGTIICLGGDFNLGEINWDSLSLELGCRKPTISCQLLDLICDFSMEQMVKEPTRQDRILDLFMTTHPNLVVQSIVCPGISDHDGIPLIDMKTKPVTEKQKQRKNFLFRKANMNELTQSLKTVSDETIAQSKQPNITVDDWWNAFKSGIHKAMDTHIPSKLSSSKYRTPWINQPIRRELRRKQRAYNKARKIKPSC